VDGSGFPRFAEDLFAVAVGDGNSAPAHHGEKRGPASMMVKFRRRKLIAIMRVDSPIFAVHSCRINRVTGRCNLAEGIMATSASPAAYVAAVAALLLSGIGVGLPIDSASADDNCASAPGAAAPAGQHWYYRFDRVNHRKCWYLHATLPLPNHAAAKHRAAPAEPVAAAATPQLPFAATPLATNAASAQPAGDPSSEAAGAQPVPAPHVTVLTVKPDSAFFVDTTSASQAGTAEQAGEPPMRQISPNNANLPVEGANPAMAAGATDADHDGLATAETAATAPVRTHSADLFFLLALAFGIAAALLALCSKMAGATRTPRLSDHPDDAWRRVIYQKDAPFLAPREPHGAADLDAHERIEPPPPAPARFPALRPQEREPEQSEHAGPTFKDIELALRALREARQSMTQT
jgi:hypothetical protein